MAASGKDAVAKLNKEQYEFLVWYEQQYWMHGSLPHYKAIKSLGIAMEEDWYWETWMNPRFADSLRSRGIPEHLITEHTAPNESLSTEISQRKSKFAGRTLSEQQMAVANVMLDTHDKRSKLKKLTELGISTATYNNWLRDPVYRRYCLERAEDLLVSSQHVAHLSLLNRVEQGDLTAIKYYNSMTGRFREKADAAVQVNVQNNTLLGNEILIKVVEVIQKHVTDTALLDAIASDILELTRGGDLLKVADAIENRPRPAQPYPALSGSGITDFGL